MNSIRQLINNTDKKNLSIFGLLFWPFSALFYIIIIIRNYLYDKHVISPDMLPGFVVSIGNIQMGGTGKTPVTVEVAKYFINLGYPVVILTRGYKSGLKKTEVAILVNGKFVTDNSPAADEALMMSSQLKDVPIVIGADRFQAANYFMLTFNKGPCIWIMDDGFQHRSLARDLDVLLLDSRFPFGNRMLFPSGNLREPASSLLRSDIIFLINKSFDGNAIDNNQIELFKKTCPEHIKITSGTASALSPVLVCGKESKPIEETSFYACCAIADPYSFSNAVKKYNIKSFYFKRDHFHFSLEDLCKDGHDAIITTEKDFFRDKEIFEKIDLPVYVLPLKIEIADLISALDSLQLNNHILLQDIRDKK